MLVDVTTWDFLFRNNLRSMMLCYKYAAIQMIAQGRGGRIIGASSLAGKRGECDSWFKRHSLIMVIDQVGLRWVCMVPRSSVSAVSRSALVICELSARAIPDGFMLAIEMGEHNITVNAYA